MQSGVNRFLLQENEPKVYDEIKPYINLVGGLSVDDTVLTNLMQSDKTELIGYFGRVSITKYSKALTLSLYYRDPEEISAS